MKTNEIYNVNQMGEVGRNLVDILYIPRRRGGYYKTSAGMKTEQGLGLAMLQLLTNIDVEFMDPEEIGRMCVDFLLLKPSRCGYFDTDRGAKSLKGLGILIQDIVNQEK